MSEDPFLTFVADALASAGRNLEIDANLNAIDVASDDAAIGSVLAIVRPIARAVTFYVVHPTLVPLGAYPDVGEFIVQSTPERLDASLEVDVSTGSVAYRMPVLLGEAQLDEETFGQLLVASVEAVESIAARFRDPLDAVIAGELTPAAAVAQVRRAPLDELQAELEELEGR